MTIEEALKQISIYPIPSAVIEKICIERQIDKNQEFDNSIISEKGYKLAMADVYKYLFFAPSSISENGVAFSLTEKEKRNYRIFANKLYAEEGESLVETTYGYKGSRL